MADPDRVGVTVAQRSPGPVVAAARGRVTPATVSELRHALVALLGDGAPVLLDVSGLQLDWAPAPEVFVTAVTAAGGWPLARLVLFGAGPRAGERLRACRVPDSVPLADTVTDAAARVEVRPARLSCGTDLPPTALAVQLARDFLAGAGDRWGLPHLDDAATVVGELVGDAVTHARTPVRLRLVLDRSGLRVSVRDGRTGPVPEPADPHGPCGGLRTAARLSRTWGVVRDDDGTAVWVQLPLRPRSAVGPGDAGPGDARDPGRAPAPRPPRRPGAGTAVVAPSHRRFTTADPEHAHAFLRTVYGAHALRVADAGGPGFHLEYDGVATNRFAVERLVHGAAVEGLFTRADGVVVVHLLGGELRLTSPRATLRAVPGDVVLCGPDTELRVAGRRLDVEVVRLAPAAVARVAADLTGVVGSSPTFHGSRPVSPARAALWRASVAHLRRDVLANGEVMASPLSRATVLRSLVALLVETFPNSVLDALDGGNAGRAPATPRTVSRAVAFINAHAGDDIGLADIAAAAGLGARGLQLAFRRNADVTPLEYLRRVRLARAHEELEESDPSHATVGAIAHRWGFPHHGSFSALYLRTYGRSPSTTLRT